MNRIAVAFVSVAVVGAAAVAGFVAGARYSSAYHQALFYEQGALEAGDSARFLTAVRGGTAQLSPQFFENRIDTAFVNLTHASRFELSPAARAELKVAADYRRRFPAAKKGTDWDARLEQGMLWAR